MLSLACVNSGALWILKDMKKPFHARTNRVSAGFSVVFSRAQQPSILVSYRLVLTCAVGIFSSFRRVSLELLSIVRF
jgi:hypothetical protein